MTTTLTDDPELPPLSPSRGRPPRWMVVLAALLSVVVLSAGVGGLWLQRQIDPPGAPGETIELEIALGSSTVAIARQLESADVISSARIFRLYLKVKGGGPFQAGRYQLQTNMAMGDVVRVLGAGPVVAYDRVTVPEGFTLDQISERVSGIERLSPARFSELATSGQIRSLHQPDGVNTLEGLLFPDTYFVDDREDEAALLTRMVAAMDTTVAELGYEDDAEAVGLTPYQAIIVASLIEREARVPEERAKVSRVIHNRLAAGMKLEIDATVLYALGSHKDRVLFRDLEIDSPYNTYRYPGLPPTPIAAPGRAALDAAIHPEPGPWKYYVVIDASGRHGFAETFAEHQANIREAQRNGVR